MRSYDDATVFLIVLLARKLRNNVKRIIVKIFKINKPCARLIDKFLIKCVSQIFVLKRKRHIIKQAIYVTLTEMKVAIDLLNALFENVGEDVIGFVPFFVLQR